MTHSSKPEITMISSLTAKASPVVPHNGIDDTSIIQSSVTQLLTVDDVQVISKDPRDLFTLHLCSSFHSFNTASVSARMSRSSSLVAVFLLAFIPCLVFSAEIPNLQPGDIAPSFVLQAKDVRIRSNDVLLKYRTGKDSNLQEPIVFLAFTNRSGFLERLLSNPDCFKELLENSPDNTNYVFLFYADSSSTVRAAARGLAQKFDSAMQAYYR